MNRILISILAITLISCQKGKERRAGICLSFDDRSVREWYAMRDLLNKYDSRATFFVSEFDSLDSVEIQMLRELERSGHEIGSHGALHVVSEYYIKENTYADYLRNEIDASISSMRKNGFDPKSFAYPYGAKYWFTDMKLLKKFHTLRGVEPINPERDLTLLDNIFYSYDGDRTLFSLGIDKGNGLTEEMIDKAIRRAVDNKEVLMLYGHEPAYHSVSGMYHFSPRLLEYILDQAQRNGMESVTYCDLFSDMNSIATH